MRNYSGYFLFFIGLLTLHVGAQSESWILNKTAYSYQDGLPGKEVTCCIQDKMGYLWIGTNNGLARFDGNVFKIFTPKTSGLNGRYIKQLHLDDSCGLIIVYSEISSPNVNIRKYDVLNIHTHEVKPLVDYYKTIPFTEERVSFIEKDQLSNQLLFYLDWSYQLNPGKFIEDEIWSYTSQKKFERKKYQLKQTIKFISKGLKSYAILEDYKLSTSINDKAFLIFTDGNIFKTTNQQVKIVMWKSDDSFICRFKEESSAEEIYFKVDLKKKSVARIEKEESRKWISASEERIITLRDNKVYWEQDELFIYNEVFGKLNIINKTEGIENHTRINDAYIDNLNNIWLCLPNGLVKVRVEKNKFQKKFTSAQSKIKDEHSARGIIGWNDTLVAGLYSSIAIANKRDTNYIRNPINFSFLKTGDSLWLGSFHLSLYDLKTKKIIYKHNSECNEIWSIYRLDAKHLLLGGTTYMMLYTIDSNSLRQVPHGNYHQSTLIYKFFKNSQAQLMAVSHNGLYILDSTGTKVIDLFSSASLDKNKKLPFTGLNDALEDKAGNYWLASVNDGIFYWNRKTNTFEQFGAEDGFVSLTTYRIHEDNYNNLWVSTDFGLVKFNLSTRKAKVYTRSDGLHENEFNRASSFKKADGTLCFGTQDGIVVFNPADFRAENKETNYPFLLNKLSCVNIRTGSEEILNYNTSVKEPVTLTEDKRNLKLSFALLDYSDQPNIYSWKVIGLDSGWNYVDRPELKLDDLTYGNFELRLRAQCTNGTWNKQEIRIPFFVKRPFYKTTLFFVLCALLFSLVIFTAIRYRFVLLKRQNVKLEEAVENRTAELKESLAEQMALLQEVHHRVKNNLQFISAMLEMQLKTIKNNANKLVLKETSRRIQAMSLVHEMLYKKDKLETVNIRDYITELVSHLTEATVEEGISVAVNLNIDALVKFNINDSVALGMIFSELFSNSIKHAFSRSKNPAIEIDITYDRSEQQLKAMYSDNGTGLSNDQNQHGLGLRLIDIFSRQLKAEHVFKNDKGLIFIFKMHYSNE